MKTLLMIGRKPGMVAPPLEYSDDVAVMQADNVETALRLQGEATPCIIVVNLQPEGAGEGLDTISRLRSHAPRTPIVAVGSETMEAEQKAIRAGASLYMLAPLNLRHLREYVRHYHGAA